jgi:FlaA1/EpsC-like NDP-sugar epimerase
VEQLKIEEASNLASRIVTRIRSDAPLVVLDILLVVATYLGTLVVRMEGSVDSDYWHSFWLFMPAIVLVHLLANYLFGLYGQMWRYASVQEARRVVLAGLSATILIVGLVELSSDQIRVIPLSVAVFGPILAFVAFGTIRFQSRLFAFRRRVEHEEPVRVIVVGVGEAGSLIVRDIHRHPEFGLVPVAFVDDDPRKVGLSLHGLRVYSRASIPSIAERLNADQVLLAIPSATSDVVREVAAQCEEVGLTLRVLPSVRETVEGRVTARDIRDLRIEDLLGRQQVEMDEELVRGMLEGRRVLITGAGGSIGSEIVRQVLMFQPERVLLLDHDETHLHDVLSGLDPSAAVGCVLADVRDRDRLLEIMRTERPHVVFHAAAHKHVPLLETHPAEALRTNILGTANVAEAANAARVERFVLVSTDKAVRPASVMGSSKWFAEQVVRSLQNGGPILCAVRFGNVLGSRGSVIPTFLRQIASGGPITVTDPEMSRFFMSIQEAVCLVLQAAAMSEGGEVFTLEMGEPVNILELARRLIRLSGRVPERDVRIEVVGRRPGEKLVEDLLDEAERPEPSGHIGIMVSHPRMPDRAVLKRALRELELLGENDEALAARMKSLAAAGFIADVVPA